MTDLSLGGRETGASQQLVIGAAASTEDKPTLLRARTISRRVWEWLPREPLEDQVLAVFQRACLLLLPGARVVALVGPEIGNGPLNIVLEGLNASLGQWQPGAFSGIEPGAAACLGTKGLRIGEMEVAMGAVEIWEPRPDWERLRRNRDPIEGRLQWLHRLALRQSPEGSLLGLLSNQTGESGDLEPGGLESGDLTGFGKPVRSGVAAIREGLQQLQAGWAGDRTAVLAGASLLAGLGAGLTPAGDDMLAGVMLWAWLAHRDPRCFCDSLLEAAVTRTTTLSAAFLRAAAGGECSAAWHVLLAALDGGSEQRLKEALPKVLSFGHTSGADTLAGFVWMGLASTHIEIA